MIEDNTFKRPALAETGDKEPNAFFHAVGEALNEWENTEKSFAHIFSKLVAPRASGFAAQRAYGTIIANPVHRQMIAAAAEIFFRNFPDAAAESELSQLLKWYGDASSRRNDFAHGIVGGDIINGTHFYFLVPNTWGSRSRKMNLEIEYRYSSEQIQDFKDRFRQLGGRASRLFERLSAVYRSAPETARDPY